MFFRVVDLFFLLLLWFWLPVYFGVWFFRGSWWWRVVFLLDILFKDWVFQTRRVAFRFICSFSSFCVDVSWCLFWGSWSICPLICSRLVNILLSLPLLGKIGLFLAVSLSARFLLLYSWVEECHGEHWCCEGFLDLICTLSSHPPALIDVCRWEDEVWFLLVFVSFQWCIDWLLLFFRHGSFLNRAVRWFLLLWTPWFLRWLWDSWLGLRFILLLVCFSSTIYRSRHLSFLLVWLLFYIVRCSWW